MTFECSSNVLSYASFFCSLSFWLGALLSYFPGAPRINCSGAIWLAILGAGILLAVVAAGVNFEKKRWISAFALALVTFCFVMFVIGS